MSTMYTTKELAEMLRVSLEEDRKASLLASEILLDASKQASEDLQLSKKLIAHAGQENDRIDKLLALSKAVFDFLN